MSSSPEHTVEVVLPGEHAAVVATIMAGHGRYPAFLHLLPDPRQRTRVLRSFLTATVRDAISFQTVLAIRDDTNITATAMWLPPGAFPWTTRRKMAATRSILPAMLTDPRASRAFMHHSTALEHAHPTEPHWYLETLSVRPEHQRQGLGSRLITPILGRADQDRLPCYLETSDPANIDYYTRFGFRVLERALITVPDGPACITMRRDAPKSELRVSARDKDSRSNYS